MIALAISLVGLIQKRKRKKPSIFIIAIIVIEMLLEVGVTASLLLVSEFTNTVASVAYVADNIDEIVDTPKYGNISNYYTELLLSGITKPTVVELDMVITEVLSQAEIRSLPNYNLVTREFLLGFPCVESSGQMIFKHEGSSTSLFKDLMYYRPEEQEQGYQTSVKGVYQIKGAGKGSRWLQHQFDSVYKPDVLSFDSPPRPHQFYIPDVVYSLATAFGGVEFGNVYARYGSYIDEYGGICGLTQGQKDEVTQALACAVYHGQKEDGGAYGYKVIRETLASYLCYAIKELGSFKALTPFAGDDFHTTVRKAILGEDSKGGELHERYQNKIKLTDGTFLKDSLIQYISDKYSGGQIMNVYMELYRRTDAYQSQFANFGYGIGSLACGDMRVKQVNNFMREYNADISQSPQFMTVREYMQSNGLAYTKRFVKLTGLSDQTGGFVVDQTNTSVVYNNETFEFPTFVYDSGRRKKDGRIELRYNIGSHLSARGFLYDIPDQLCIGGRNTAMLTCDIRVIPALHAMSKAWELYDNLTSKTGNRIEITSAYRTYEQAVELMVMWANRVALLGHSNWQLKDAQYIMDNAYQPESSIYNTSSARNLRKFAAEPGTSAHFTGRVFDFNLSGNPAVHSWLVNNARSFGFYPYDEEDWHWEYNPVLTERGESL